MNQYQKLIKDLKTLGIKKGMTVIVHSSFKSLCFTEGGPELVIKAFQDVLTKEGTLIIPTLSYKTVNSDNPYFSINETPSCVGIISEVFRKMPDVYRSLNPIHSVAAWGKYAFELTKDHYKDNITLGSNSPFYLMLKHDPKICMLGCGLKPNTFMHLVENINEVPYRIIKRIIPMKLKDKDNNIIEKEIYLPDMSNYIQRYDRVKDILEEPDITFSYVLSSLTYLIDANGLLENASSILKNNPFYFVDEITK